MDAATQRDFGPGHLDGEDEEPLFRFRSIFISDVHLGTPGCQARALLSFLRHTESRELYLVGDIVDGWQLKRRWYWHQSHNDVVQKVLRKARKGTRVTYIAGNHDEATRHFVGLAFGGIDIRDEAVHVTADGKRLLVTHGDVFDAVVQVSQFLKHRVKNAVSYVTRFERALADEARRRGFDGVVCGHIHKAEIRDIDGVRYCNDGDWVESLTALVELESGELRIIDWKALPDLWHALADAKGAALAHSAGD